MLEKRLPNNVYCGKSTNVQGIELESKLRLYTGIIEVAAVVMHSHQIKIVSKHLQIAM